MVGRHSGTVTGRWSGSRYHATRWHSCGRITHKYNMGPKQWAALVAQVRQKSNMWMGFDLATVHERMFGTPKTRRLFREKMQRREGKALRMVAQITKSYDRRMKMKRSHAIESLVRRKNNTYHKWRTEHDFNVIDDASVECMMRFGALPRWEEYVRACRRQIYNKMEEIQKEHSAWRKEVREWALTAGITRFKTQSAQFLKFYFAWWRYEHEKRDGPVTREYGRQMG